MKTIYPTEPQKPAPLTREEESLIKSEDLPLFFSHDMSGFWYWRDNREFYLGDATWGEVDPDGWPCERNNQRVVKHGHMKGRTHGEWFGIVQQQFFHWLEGWRQGRKAISGV